jgi:hypothetical protein
LSPTAEPVTLVKKSLMMAPPPTPGGGIKQEAVTTQRKEKNSKQKWIHTIWNAETECTTLGPVGTQDFVLFLLRCRE